MSETLEIDRDDLEKLLDLLESLDHVNHWDRGTGAYEEDELITKFRTKYFNGERA